MVDDSEDEGSLPDDDNLENETSIHPIPIRLSAITEIFSDNTPFIYLCTLYSWYRLHRPSEEYLPVYTPVYIRHRLTSLFASIISKNAPPALKRIHTWGVMRHVLDSEGPDIPSNVEDLAYEVEMIIKRKLRFSDIVQNVSCIFIEIALDHTHSDVPTARSDTRRP